MTSVESQAVIMHEEEEGAGVPSCTPSPSTKTLPTLFILKPGQASQCGQDLCTNQDRSLATPGTPAETVQDLPPMTLLGPTAKATSPLGDLSTTCTDKGVTVTLHNSHLWNEFHGCRTEMILTKQGRHMFPYCTFSIAGLEPLKRYVLVMDFAPMDKSRWKWNGHEWKASGQGEPHVLGRMFIHPDSPSLGHCWTQSSVSFYKLKLTNNTQDKEGHVILRSMHRYLPQLHLVPADTVTSTIQLNGPEVVTFAFPQTEFIAVTTYQNLRITQLKIDYNNHFARDFHEEQLYSQLSKPGIEPSDPLLCSSSSNGSKRKLRDLQKTLKSLFRPSKDKTVEQELQQTACCGAGFLNGVDSPIRGEKRPNPEVCSEQESKLKVRRADPQRRNGVYAEKEIELVVVDNVSREPQLKNRSRIASRRMLAMQGDDRVWLTAGVHASVSLECEDFCATPTLSLINQKKIGSIMKPKPTAFSSKSLSTFPTSLSLSQKSSPDSQKSLYPSFRGSPAGPVPTPLSKPSSVGSDKGVSPRCQATPGKKVNLEAATSAHSPSGMTQLTSTNRRHSGKFKKYITKSGVSAQKVAEQPVEATILPDLEDVEGMLFVSFVSKEALGAHLGDLPLCTEEHVPLQEKTDHPKIIEAVETVEDKIAGLQDLLLMDLQRLEHRQVIHTVLQKEGAPFLSRTGKTNDFTKIKGWREKFVASGISSVKPPDANAGAGADAGADPGLRNRSAFCSDMLDEYLERESRLMDMTAAGGSSPSSPPLVHYQLPTKSSSYIRPLHTVLNKQAPKPTLPRHPLKHLPACPKPKPKPNCASGPASIKAPALSGVKRRLSTSYCAKPAAKCQAAAKKVLAPPPSSPAARPHAYEASVKPDFNKSVRALARVMLKLMVLENRAAWQGKNPTTITKERAEQALTALLTAQGTCKGSRVHTKDLLHWVPPCRQAFCRLGCVCASLAKKRRVITHCRKPACMFGCSCLKRTMVLIKPSLTSPQKPDQGARIGQKTPGEEFSLKSEPDQGILIGQKTTGEEFSLKSEPEQDVLIGQKTTGEEFSLKSEPEQDALIGQETLEEEFSLKSEPEQVALIGQKIPGEAFPSTSEPEQGDFVALEMIGEESASNHEKKKNKNKNNKKKKKKKKKKRKKEKLSYAVLEAETEVELEVEPMAQLRRLWTMEEGEVDPEPLHIPTPLPSAVDPEPLYIPPPLPSADSQAPKSATLKTYVPRPNPVVRDEDKDPVYLYFESMMTCARVREYTSKPPPQRPLCYCKSILCSGKEDDLHHNSPYLIQGSRQYKVKAKPPQPPQPPQPEQPPQPPQPEQPPQPQEEPCRILEIVSECDWESERNNILADVCRRTSPGDLSQPFRIGSFLIQPYVPAFRKEGDTCSVTQKVLITRPSDPSLGKAAEKSPPIDCDESERNNILADVCRRTSQGDHSQPFCIGSFLIQPYVPAFRKEGDTCSVTQKVLITRPPEPSLEKAAEKSPPIDCDEAPKQERAKKGLPLWSDILPAGLLTAKRKQPGLPAKGLIEVNGKSYSQAKVQLGQMGALHMTSRLAAYLTGRWRPANQKRSVKSPPTSESVRRSSSESFTPLPAHSTGAATTSTSGVLKPLEIPAEPMLLVPVEHADSASAAPPSAGSLVPLAPGETMVLHPVRGPSGESLFRHPNGQLVHLLPLNQLHTALPNLLGCSTDTEATSPTTLLPPPCPPETAPQPAPGFHTIRIGPGVGASAGFTPLHVPLGPPSQGPGTEPWPAAQTYGGGPGRPDAHAFPRGRPRYRPLCCRNPPIAPKPAEAPAVARVKLRRAAGCETASEAEIARWVSERGLLLDDMSEDCVGNAEAEQEADVDVETVEELPGEKLTNAGLNRQAKGQAELDKKRLDVDAERQGLVEMARRRRGYMKNLFTRLEDALGIESMALIPRLQVLSLAMEEIQTLVDQCNRLKQEKIRMTEERAVYIRKIAQSSGKPEKLIIRKLQDICAKQRSLEAKKKKAQQRSPGPDRMPSPPTPASENGSFILPRIVSVRSLATTPQITTATREQDDSEAT
ncbi:hypothetical protein SKAU_G00190330 [Synaphobranchus kaupii]|uniref:T-box domain-containing protein n=1 Tax=Synaphobranchus kaupii TaxID=118154 RepID=A0A9Q1FDK5_SYNKA|nr:hypothetical protein SKAU_G00190330 [Synaphobranchus kaupii]